MISRKPSKDELLKVIKELNANMVQIGKHFKVTDNAVRKWCKFYDIPHLKKEL